MQIINRRCSKDKKMAKQRETRLSESGALELMWYLHTSPYEVSFLASSISVAPAPGISRLSWRQWRIQKLYQQTSTDGQLITGPWDKSIHPGLKLTFPFFIIFLVLLNRQIFKLKLLKFVLTYPDQNLEGVDSIVDSPLNVIHQVIGGASDNHRWNGTVFFLFC